MAARLRVLHIDDDLLSRAVVRAMLGLKDVALTERSCAADSLEQIRSGEYDLVLMDLRMNDTSGLQVLEALRATPGLKATPVVIVTGDARDSVAKACRAAGAVQVVHKPVSLQGLFRVVDAATLARAA